MTSQNKKDSATKPAILIQIFNSRVKQYDQAEMHGLIKTAGYMNYTQITQHLKRINPKSFLGSGKVKIIEDAIKNFFDPESMEKPEYHDITEEGLQDSEDEELSYNDLIETDEKSNDNSKIHSDPTLDLNLNANLEVKSDAGPDTRSDTGSDARSDAHSDYGSEVGSDAGLFGEDELILDLPETLSKPDDLTIIFNNRLGHNQMMYLRRIWGVKVIDRDDLVLEIFEKHAQTRESKLQIELAKITLQTNIIKKEVGEHLQEKQGRGFMGKGRAAWEPQMRAFRGQKKKISYHLNEIAKNRNLLRKRRSKYFNVGIIGYTNAGKSTFLNRLAKSGVKTANQEFTTVSTTSRKVTFPRFDNYGNWKGEDVIFTDSVGFITDMSQILIDAFLSTLEELKFSNLLVIVIDIAEPDIARIWTKISTSFQIIEKIGATEIPKLFVFNKIDLVTPTKCENRIKTIHEHYISIPFVSISALEKKGFERLAKEIIAVKHQYFSKKLVKF